MDEENGHVPVHHPVREIQPYAEPGGSWTSSHIPGPPFRDQGPTMPIVYAPSEFDALVAGARRLLDALPGGVR